MPQNKDQKNFKYGHFLRSGDPRSYTDSYIAFKQYFNDGWLYWWKIDIGGQNPQFQQQSTLVVCSYGKMAA